MSKAAKLAKAFAELDRLYALLPSIACQGRCAIACGPVIASELEARRLQLTTHVKPRTIIRLLADGGAHTEIPRERCVYLTPEDRCSAYAVRPFICRAWGLVKPLSCMHGCVPEYWLRDTAFVRLAKEVERVAGRILRTSPEGLLHVPGDTYADLNPQRTEADIDADSERTRSLRALHGGRIIAAVMKGSE
jgi:Fe-S-cluster containining protein